MSIFAPALLNCLAPEQKGAGDEFRPKKLPIAQSTSVQCAPAASAALARREGPFPQSDTASRSKSHGCALQSNFARGVARCRLRRGARSCKTPILRESGLSTQDN